MTKGKIKPKLLDWTRNIASQIAESGLHLSVGFEFYALASRWPEGQEALQGFFHRYQDLLGQIIQLGIDQGEFSDVDPLAIADTMIALFEGFNVLWFMEPQSQKWQDRRIKSVELLLDFISA